MKTLALVVIGSLGLAGTTFLSDAYMKSEVSNANTRTFKPPHTSIIIPTLNEEAYILNTLSSLENQNIRLHYPQQFEVIVVDSESTDRTRQLAEKHAQILTCPIGKLTARHKGILNAKGKIIIGVDADTFYPPNYLNLVLRHFKNPNVVGVSSPRLFGRDANPLLNTGGIWHAIWDGMRGRRMPGSNSAFLKTAYYKVGGFNLTINQQNSTEMVAEEEYAFPNRLRRLGTVVWDWKAPGFTSARRHIRGEKRSFDKPYNDFPLLYPEA